jgi:hypothetical protein
MKKERKKRTTKRLLMVFTIIVITVGIILLALQLLINHFEEQLADRFIAKIEKKWGNIYSIRYEKVDLNFFMRSIRIANLSITPRPDVLPPPDSTAEKKKLLLDTSCAVLKAEGISLSRLLFNNTLEIKRLKIEKGKLTLLSTEIAPGNSKDDSNSQNGTRLHIPEASVWLNNLEINPARKEKKANNPSTPRITIGSGEAVVKDPVYFTRDGFYRLKARKLHISKTDSAVSIRGLELIPAHEVYEFSRKRGYQSTRAAIRVPGITVEQVDFDELLNRLRFSGKRAEIDKLQVSLFRNQNMPRKKGPKKELFPRELLERIKFPLHLEEINISDSTITYTAHAEKARRPGRVYFTDVEAHLKHFSNDHITLHHDKPLELTASARVMGRSLLDMKALLRVTARYQNFTVSGSMKKMDLRALNPVLISNAHLRIESGILDRLTFSIRGSTLKAEGQMKLFYRNLKISLLKRRKSLERRRFASFLANTIILTQNPRKGKSLRVGNIYYIKDVPMSIFKFTWDAFQEGIKSSIGLKRRKH